MLLDQGSGCTYVGYTYRLYQNRLFFFIYIGIACISALISFNTVKVLINFSHYHFYARNLYSREVTSKISDSSHFHYFPAKSESERYIDKKSVFAPSSFYIYRKDNSGENRTDFGL